MYKIFSVIKDFLIYIKWRTDLYFVRKKHVHIKSNIIWIDPKSIDLIIDDRTLHDLNLLQQKGILMEGDWDVYASDIDENDFFQSAYMRYVEKKSWKNTPFYHRVLKQINSGQEKFLCKNQFEWENRLEKDDALFDKMKEVGFIPQYKINRFKPWDEIRVAINRENKLIFLDGRHRLAFARILNIKSVPVFICVYHSDLKRVKN